MIYEVMYDGMSPLEPDRGPPLFEELGYHNIVYLDRIAQNLSELAQWFLLLFASVAFYMIALIT